jgi:RHS repeat-associated protein
VQRSNEQSVIAYFLRDANGYPYALKYNGTTYYYITNLQGDVMYLVDANENTVASYEYDPYGNIVSATGTMAEINPLRYRGYYYDAELEMYYLQSRYHDHQIGRFIKTNIPIT